MNLGSLRGYRFCLTGEMWAPLHAIADGIRDLGGVVVTIPRDVVILVDGTIPGTSRKTQDAKRNGCRIISPGPLKAVLAGHITIEQALNKKTTRKATPVEPLDRVKYQQAVDQVTADLALIGK